MSEEYSAVKKAQTLKKVRERHPESHKKARQLLEDMGFAVEKDSGPIANKPWDFVAKKGGLTYCIDTRNPYSQKGQFKISVSEMRGMLNPRKEGIPAYLFILPENRYILFEAE